MRICKITIEKLFGYYNYSFMPKNNITIIHGPNGCGKTTMLKIIDAVFNKKPNVLASIDFQNVVFEFDDERSLQIERKKLPFKFPEMKENNMFYLTYCLITCGKKKVFDPLKNKDQYGSIMKNILHGPRIPFIEPISDNNWFDRRTNEKITTEDVISRYGQLIFRRTGLRSYYNEIPEEIQELIKDVKVYLIAADRLTVQKKVERPYGEDSLKVEQKVDVIAKDISERIKNAIQNYALISQSKDRTFPLRVIKTKDSMPVEEIKKKMYELEEKRKQFVDTGILEENDDVDIHELVDAITEGSRQNLSLYATDTEEKLNVLSGLSESINLFRTLIERNFNNKKIIFNKEYGFHFITTYSNNIIYPENLSSGEQHELVMFYDLIFNTSPDTLVLVDEPELSLHIKWQLGYIDELFEIIKVSGFYAILATHSPQIIHDNWDITVSLSSEE